MLLNNNHPDLEPLIVDSKNSSPSTKNNQWRFNKKVKLPGLLRRRDPKAYQEKCGRIRLLLILCAFAFLLIYLSNLAKPYGADIMIVKIPPDDASLPGPKGYYNNHIYLFALFAFCHNFCCSYYMGMHLSSCRCLLVIVMKKLKRTLRTFPDRLRFL